ncbi:hypothetical protein HM1_0856 [Heliomicrobium modesticaldum Ice1]|uniref:Uncharacterized protein n=1 Tax=Heliobacterium modesticaldum (strain ATCC 51547 / Ice1) TaxID=498761 RepID=B0TAQ3_HELMI|nr:hypothetical protein HM1_0856 [Heliomicrobium modesticaldum Ice1]
MRRDRLIAIGNPHPNLIGLDHRPRPERIVPGRFFFWIPGGSCGHNRLHGTPSKQGNGRPSHAVQTDRAFRL